MEKWKRNLMILCIGQFLFMASMSQIIPFLPLYLQELGLKNPDHVSKWSGIIFGAQFLTAFLISPLWGKLADRYGRKLMIIRSGIGMSVITTLMGFAGNHIHLLILRLINGTISGFIPAAIALTSTNTPKKHVGYSLGILQSSAVAGTICGPLIGGYMADFLGFRTIFLYTGIMVFLATVIVILFVHEKFERKDDEPKTSFVDDFKVIISRKPILSLFVIATMVQLALLGTLPMIPLFVQELVGNSDYLAFFAGLAGAVMGFANMLASPKLGKWGDRFGSQYVLMFCIVGATILSIPQAFVTELWQLILFRFLTGVCLGGLLPSIHALIRHYAPDGMESRTYSYSNSAIFLGNLMGPIIGGFFAASYGVRSVFLWSAILLCMSIIWVKWMIVDKIKKSEHYQQAVGNVQKHL